ncbi:hypothetical protein, partial [Streptomyces sp. ADI95-17]|uniref:hypothetical protein n=1 Tax=Streptomyces sp. ADI95-17 TaxID=1522759 RepID=UPI0019D1652C
MTQNHRQKSWIRAFQAATEQTLLLKANEATPGSAVRTSMHSVCAGRRGVAGLYLLAGAHGT